MSTFKQKKELKAQIAAATKAGKSRQTIGRLQYKLNNLTADPKGNVVKKKNGSVVKTGSGGVVRTKPTSTVNKKRPITKRSTPLRGSPSAGTAPKKKAVTPKNKVTVTPYRSANITHTKLPASTFKSPTNAKEKAALMSRARSGNKAAQKALARIGVYIYK
jgi:hypothetical protein